MDSITTTNANIPPSIPPSIPTPTTSTSKKQRKQKQKQQKKKQVTSTPCISTSLRYIDIGANLVDEMFSGKYFGKAKHQPDVDRVLERCWQSLDYLFMTSGSLEDLETSIKIVSQDDRLFTTMGVHPTMVNFFVQKDHPEAARGHNADIPSSPHRGDPDAYLNALLKIYHDDLKSSHSQIIAFGEIGLDYDRLEWSPKNIQIQYLKRQLDAFSQLPVLKPLFLHNRNCGLDLVTILKEYPSLLKVGGVVHSFTGTKDELDAFLDLGLYIGINGCSLKTEDNAAVVKHIPDDRILLETDAPWCTIRSTSAGYPFIKTHPQTVKNTKWDPEFQVKSRNEPINIIQVFEALAGIRGLTENDQIEKFAHTIYNNTTLLFGIPTITNLDETTSK